MRAGVPVRLIGVLLLALLVVGLAGCTRSGKPSPVGSWRVKEAPGQPAGLSDLTLTADGRFTYGGKNAFGGAIQTAGVYTTGMSNGKPWIKLAYADDPKDPTVWFYQLDDNTLTVSPAAGTATTGSTLVFTRQ